MYSILMLLIQEHEVLCLVFNDVIRVSFKIKSRGDKMYLNTYNPQIRGYLLPHSSILNHANICSHLRFETAINIHN